MRIAFGASPPIFRFFVPPIPTGWDGAGENAGRKGKHLLNACLFVPFCASMRCWRGGCRSAGKGKAAPPKRCRFPTGGRFSCGLPSPPFAGTRC
ncbi:hypothetical protein HMPREF0262_00013 [Clostridium sp. ATCC 29733]|nr:hypothetical protein HMPREF0262_00013 [Clostridium sp. ATCC 29733]